MEVGGHGRLRTFARIGDAARHRGGMSGICVRGSQTAHRVSLRRGHGIDGMRLTRVGEHRGSGGHRQRALGHFQRVLATGGVVVVVRSAHIDRLRAYMGERRDGGGPVSFNVVIVLAVPDGRVGHIAGSGRSSVSRAIIHMREVRRTGHHHLQGSRGDLQPTVLGNHKGDTAIGEISTAIMEIFRFQMHGIHTGISAVQRERAIGALELCIRVKRVRGSPSVAGDRVVVAVIHTSVLVTGDGHRDVLRERSNGQITVHWRGKRHIEVVVRVGELRSGKTHVRGTLVRAHRCGVATEREVVLGIKRARIGFAIVTSHRATYHALLGSVIDLGVVVTGDGHRDSSLLHFQRAGHCGDVVVVSVGASIERIDEIIGGGARKGLATGHVIRNTLTRNKAILAHVHRTVGQRGTVVILGSTFGSHLDIALVHLQGAINGGTEGVAVGHHVVAVLHLVARHLVRRLAGIGLGTTDGGNQLVAIRQGCAICSVSCRHSIAVFSIVNDRVACIRQRRTVVESLTRPSRNLNLIRNWRDGHGAVRHLEGHVREVRSIFVSEVAREQTHGGRTYHRAGGEGITCIFEFCIRVERIGGTPFIALDGMGLAIIHFAVGMTDNGHHHRIGSRNGQRTRNCLNVIVACLSILFQHVWYSSECILAATHCRLRTCDIAVQRILFADEAITADGDLMVG